MKFQHYFYDGTDMSALSGGLVHPRQALALPGADELLQRIACAPAGSVLLDNPPPAHAHAAEQLCCTGVLRCEDRRLYFDCPVILQQDQRALAVLISHHAEKLAGMFLSHRKELQEIVAFKADGFPAQRHLYHMLCGGVLDGSMFDHLEQSCLVSTGKPLATGADCLTILYEDTPGLNQFSDELLCSFNRLRTEKCTFVSYGDSNGLRHDFYRWFVCRSTNRPELRDTSLDMLLPASLPELREEAGRQWLNVMEGHTLSEAWHTIFQHFGYLDQSCPCVPVYTAAECEAFQSQLDDLVAPLLLPELRKVLSELSACTELTAITHGVKPADLANEVYHILFGQINEQLVRSGMVSQPPHIPGEGRFLRWVEMNE